MSDLHGSLLKTGDDAEENAIVAPLFGELPPRVARQHRDAACAI
jgi:hypothetical protein